mgnify:CR=1 FL=1
MMDRNTTIGLILIGLLLTVFTIINQPSKEDIERAKKEQAIKKGSDKESKKENNKKSTQQESSNQSDQTIKQPVAPKKVETFTLENKQLAIVLSSKGARVEAVYLKDYKSYDDFSTKKNRSLCLFKDDDAANYFFIPGVFSTEDAIFESSKESDGYAFNYTKGKKSLKISYALKEEQRLAYSIHFDGFSKLEMDQIRFKWKLNFRRTERKLKEQRRITTICFEQKNEGLDYLSETSNDYATAEDDLNWVACKQSYFSSILHPEYGFKKEDGKFLIKKIGRAHV